MSMAEYVQDPLPLPGEGWYNLGVPPSAGHRESTKEILLVVLASMVELLAHVEMLHPGILDELEGLVSRGTESGD